MTSKQAVREFLAARRVAVVGVSQSGKGFGALAYKELKAKGYDVVPVHPTAETILGDPCAHNLRELAGRVDAALVVVPPDAAQEVMKDAAAAGISHVWLQQGADSPEAWWYGRAQGINVIRDECILMFAEPAGFIHKAHRGWRHACGRLPR
jgi:predicted CoA-binding protein